MDVRRPEIQPVAPERDASLDEGRSPLLQRVIVLPEEIAGLGVDRLHDLPVAQHEHRSVAHQRHDFGGARGERPTPDDPQRSRVGSRNLCERTEAVRVPATPPGQPVLRRRTGQIRLLHGFEMVERVGQHYGLERRIRRVAHDAEAASRHHDARQHARIGRQRILARYDRVFLENVGNEGCVRSGVERAGLVARHRRSGDLVEIAHAMASILAHEFGTLERLPERAITQMGPVTRDAVGGVRRATLLALLTRVGQGGLLRLHGDGDGGQCHHEQQCISKRLHRAIIRYHYAPQGLTATLDQRPVIFGIRPLVWPSGSLRLPMRQYARGQRARHRGSTP